MVDGREILKKRILEKSMLLGTVKSGMIRNLKTLQINNFRTSRRKMKIVKFLHHIISHSFWKRTEEFSKYLVAVALTVTEL